MHYQTINETIENTSTTTRRPPKKGVVINIQITIVAVAVIFILILFIVAIFILFVKSKFIKRLRDLSANITTSSVEARSLAQSSLSLRMPEEKENIREAMIRERIEGKGFSHKFKSGK